MKQPLLKEMNRIWQMKTVDFIEELGATFRKVEQGYLVKPETLAAINHRLYSMFHGSVRLNRECYAVFEAVPFFDLKLLTEGEQYDISDALKTLITKCHEADVFERDPFSWLAERPTL